MNSYSSDNALQLSAKDKKSIEIYDENGTKISGCEIARLCVDPLPPNATLTKYYGHVKKVIYSPISEKREERLLYKVRYGYQKGNYWINGTGWIEAEYTNQPQLNAGGDSKPSRVSSTLSGVSSEPSGAGSKKHEASSEPSGSDSKQHKTSPSKPTAAPVANNPEVQVKPRDSITIPEDRPQPKESVVKPKDIIHPIESVPNAKNKLAEQSVPPQKDSQNEKTYPVSQKSTPIGQSYSRDFEKILERIDQDTALKNIESINRDSSKLINNGIGKCIATQDKINKNLHGKWEGKEFIYDEVFLPEALKLKAKPLDIKDENNKHISDQDLREIDVLARTIYAEVSNCFEYKVLNEKKEVVATIDTLEYPMFVAATAKNRVDYIENVVETKEFVAGKHRPEKGIYAKVLTTNLQYSPWNKPKPKDEITSPKDYKALRHLLCPPRKTNDVYYSGSKPPLKEVENFELAVKMAMEAVLYPTLFSARAHEFWQFFFTSGVHKFHDMKKTVPSIHGRKLDNEACIIVWDGLPAGFKIDPDTKKTDPKFFKLVEKGLNAKKVNPDSISDKDTGRKRRALATYHFYESKLKSEHAVDADEPKVTGTP